MRNESKSVGLVETMRRGSKSIFYRTLLLSIAIVGFGGGVLLEIREELAVRDLWHFLPLRANGGDRILRLSLGRRRRPDEVSVTDNDHTSLRSCRAVIERGKRGSERWRAQDLAVQHAGRTQVGSVLMASCDERAVVDFREGFPGDRP